MEWDGHFGPATARSRSLRRSVRPRSASPGRHTYYAGSPAPTKASSLYAPTASSAARQRYADQAEASYPQRPLYGTAAAVQGRYRDGAYETTHHTPQVVGYQEVPVYEQLVHRESASRTRCRCWSVPIPCEVERLVEVPVPWVGVPYPAPTLSLTLSLKIPDPRCRCRTRCRSALATSTNTRSTTGTTTNTPMSTNSRKLRPIWSVRPQAMTGLPVRRGATRRTARCLPPTRSTALRTRCVMPLRASTATDRGD